MRPKKVAIIGAGPSGLVTAKTLLHSFPRGTFSPVIFDSRHEVGGLWPNDPSGPARTATGPQTLDPSMRTNLSRFTVAFSDLSWESVMGDADIPMFPRAKHVGQYLAAYVEQYIPSHVLRLGHRVTRTLRTAEADSTPRWKVEWSKTSSRGAIPQPDDAESEDFDFLVVASGYFARPYLPEIPGLEHFAGQIIHSSILHQAQSLSPCIADGIPGGIAVIGGSMSGVEAASAAALWKSSLAVSTRPITLTKKETKVHHIHSRPFWALPTYLPFEASEETVPFLPLDLTMYDLSRRPTGPIEYALGPITEDKARLTNGYFSLLLGGDYMKLGHRPQTSPLQPTSSRPSWVAIGNSYAEFIRSGAIEPTMGRVISGSPDPDTGLTSISIETDNGESKTLNDIATIVMATGFTPFESLSFLPSEVLQGLEYTGDDTFLPLVLDKGGTMRSEIPDLGFVGFYRGPYWGVIEMQARFLSEEWAGQQVNSTQTGDQRESVRTLRHPDTSPRRGQFPMGDYVGLMESFARDLHLRRTEMLGGDGRSGPVIPARYVHDHSVLPSQKFTTANAEVQRTLDSLHAALKPESEAAQAGAALAVFRALHGTWRFLQKIPTAGQERWFGTKTFHPRCPSSPGYDHEYVCEERMDILNEDILDEPRSRRANWSVLRLSEGGTNENSGQIEVWSMDEASELTSALELTHSLRLTPFYYENGEGENLTGEYVIYASVVRPDTDEKDPRRTRQYIFHFLGVSIFRWECIEFDDSLGESRPGEQTPSSRIMYSREDRILAGLR